MKPRKIEHADALGDRPAFFAHGLEPGPLGAPEAEALLRRGTLRREPGRPLPAAAGAEAGTLGLEPVVERAGPRRASGRALLERVSDRVFPLVQLDRLGDRVGLGRIARVAARVERPEVPLGLAVGDPFGERLAGTGGLDDAEGEAAALVEVLQPVRRANVGKTVGRIGDRAVDHPLHADRAQDRHARDRGLDVGLQAVEVVREQLVREVLGDAVQPVRPRLPLVGSEQEARALLAQIVGDVGIAQQRQLFGARFELGDALGHEVLVRHGDDRQRLADHGHDLAGPVAGGVDQDLAVDFSPVGDHPPGPARARLEAGHAGEAADLAALVARPAGECLGQLARIDVAVIGIEQRALEVVELEEGIELARLRSA